MSNQVKIELSRRWKEIVWVAYAAVLIGLVARPILGQIDESMVWRRTSQGWECAHAVQQMSSLSFKPQSVDPAAVNPSTALLHRILLPISVGSFFVTFGCWLLIGVPNRGIVRRLSASKLD